MSIALQKKFYSAERKHEHLQYYSEDLYVKNLINYLISFSNIKKEDNVLEIGAGAGRFTIHLLKAGFNVTCMDISKSQLRRLKENAKKIGIPADKLKIHCTSIEDMDTDNYYDAVIGFYILHHLDIDNIKNTFLKFRKLLKHNGKICFLEPNRLNLLFALQILFQKDMDFRYEKGLFKLSKNLLKKALISVQYENIVFGNFGFFPPQIINRFPFTLKCENILEKVPFFNKFLPFLLMTAENASL